MENEVLKKLRTLIEALTHSGSNTLDEDIMKQVKKICKSSQSNVSLAYELVLEQLKKNNSQIRLAAFQICKELFKRSAQFRENVLKDLKLIFELVSEINSSKKLPPPESSAKILKASAVSTLKEWVKDFGEAYKKLKVAYNYFKIHKQVDFDTLAIGYSSEQVVQNEHLRIVNEEKIKRVLEEFNSNKSEIELTITTLANCLSLLLPPVEEFFIPEVNLNKPSTSKAFTTDLYKHGTSNCTNSKKCDENTKRNLMDNTINLREFGIPLDYNLTLQLNTEEKFKVVKTEENISIIENAKDCVRLICNRYLPIVKKWIKICCKCSNGSSNEIKKIIDLKEKLEEIIKKHNLIIIDDSCCILDDENSSDDDFEEVNKEGYEASVNFSEVQMLDCFKEKSNVIDSSPVPQTLKSLSEEEKPLVVNISEQGSSGTSRSTSEAVNRKKKLLSIAPKLPYDIDLYHWEDEHLSTPTLISSKIDVDKFWGSAGSDDIHEIPNPNGVAALRTRVIEYSGVFEPVKWACRAPLPSGKLCPRKDRLKCPFHGKIVARDDMGNIQHADDQKNLDQNLGKRAAIITDLQNTEYLRDLQAATGVDLKIPERKDKKRKSEKMNLTHKKMKTSVAALKIVEAKKLPGLVDVVKGQNNAYTRLSKKIFNRSSLRRVSSVLNRLDKKKFIDKFGDQFNYL